MYYSSRHSICPDGVRPSSIVDSTLCHCANGRSCSSVATVSHGCFRTLKAAFLNRLSKLTGLHYSPLFLPSGFLFFEPQNELRGHHVSSLTSGSCISRMSSKNVATPDRVQPYQHDDLPTEQSFRITEILPGDVDSPISCLLHVANWSDHPEYEAVSYTWGDANVKAAVLCHGQRLEITASLYQALNHLKLSQRSRFLWTDALW